MYFNTQQRTGTCNFHQASTEYKQQNKTVGEYRTTLADAAISKIVFSHAETARLHIHRPLQQVSLHPALDICWFLRLYIGGKLCNTIPMEVIFWQRVRGKDPNPQSL